jgi:hypothetical protein
MAELAEQVDAGPREDERADRVSAVLADALVREAVGLIVVLGIMVLIDPTMRALARQLAGRVFRRRPDARKAAEDAAVADFARRVSDFEKGGGCGCG